jgi:hypothetical protein
MKGGDMVSLDEAQRLAAYASAGPPEHGQAVHRRYSREQVGTESSSMTEWQRREASRDLFERKLRGELTSEAWLRAERALWDQLP